MRRLTATLLWLFLSAGLCRGQAEKPFLFQKPTLNKTHIVFAFAGDLWSVPRAGGEAARLTTGAGVKSDPRFSPDGSRIAFTAEYDGNTDVYLMPAQGGVPRRLTYHPAGDQVIGWTPDGARILFASARSSYTQFPRLFSISPEGGFPTELPLPIASEAAFSPDGARLAYVPKFHWQAAWKRYRGGQTKPIWLTDLTSLKIEKVPRDNSNDYNPMWIGGKVYFLSDRKGPVTLFSYDTATKRVAQVLPNDGLDIKAACAGPGAIVYEQFGALHLLDLATGKAQPVPVRIAADLPEVRPRYVRVGNRIASAGISPSGARAVFEARGEILTVPAEKGSIRNLTGTPGVMERDPSWSPDGKWIAYFSDESGEYALHLREQNGMGEVRKISLGNPPSFYYSPTWSPDSKKIAYSDKHLNLWYVDIEKKTPVRVDTTSYFTPGFTFDPAWSPDSRWLTYRKELKSHINAICLFSLETGQSSQVTDGLSDARYAVFDRSGKYLFFTASTNVGLTTGWLNMTSVDRPVSRSVYVAVLRKDLPSPLAPESDEEKVKEPEKPADKPAVKPGEKDAAAPPAPDAGKTPPKEDEKVRVDFENLSQRILSLPLPARNYIAMQAGKAGILFVLESPAVGFGLPSLQRFDLSTRKAEKALDGVGAFAVSANGEKLLYNQGPRWAIAATAGPVNPGAGALSLDGMEVYADPRAEWRQMYNEAWRLERDFFYDPGMHGLDYKTISAKYAPYLDNLASRADLNYLFEEMLGEMTCGHVFVSGGDIPEPNRVGVGLLGADYALENGRYRFTRIYNGENWNPSLRAPLTQPGVNVAVGEYLLAVNGRDALPTAEVYKYFEETAGKQIVLKVGPTPDGKGAREVTVVPIDNENGLRNLAWVEDNRRKVDKLSGGRLAYVYLPDTYMGGYTYFNRYFFAQVGKEGAIIDERFNGGGLIADYIIDYLRRPLMGYFAARDGADYITPVGSIYGPKVMIINEYAGSGGDMMPWLFRAARIGPLVGTRTWGGLVGMAGAASLMDGGFTGAPQSGFWNPNGTWDVENHGVDPDIEVEMDPAVVRTGRDPQLEKAVEVALAELKAHPLPKHTRPAYPNYQKKEAAR